jgi:S-adenosylmethionine synthetase
MYSLNAFSISSIKCEKKGELSMTYLFTSESVCAGHPDKICDQISDAVVDAALKVDPKARVAVECGVKESVFMIGEVTAKSILDYAGIARRKIRDLGYTKEIYGFTDKSPITVQIKQQSGDIAKGVDHGGAGDQGLMFGYACRQTPEFMPLPIVLAHRLARKLDELMESYDFLRPDGKTQVTVKYEGRKPVKVETVVLAKPHDPKVGYDELKAFLFREAVLPVLDEYNYSITPKQLILNGTGKWEMGGPVSDSGVTGRKIIVDTYGGWARHGGGCFSGKDPTKVDRSGAYAARWVAKNIVAVKLAEECEVQVAYVIGQPEPVSLMIETFGTEKKSQKLIREFVNSLTSFNVKEILEKLDLRKPIFAPTATYGHFGREGVSWEKIV